MNKIITRPEEIVKNEQVLYAGNHYLSVPIIDCQSGAIKNINVVSLSNKALVELKGEANLFTPHFYKEGKEIEIEKIDASKEQYYLPRLDFFLKGDIRVTGRIFADLKEKGLIYSFESSEEIRISLFFDLKYVSFLRFNSHKIDTKKIIKRDKWLGNPLISIFSYGVSLALAFDGDKDFEVDDFKGKETLNLKISCQNKNCFYIAVNYDPDGASTTLIHLRRKGYCGIYNEFLDWLKEKTIHYPKDPALEARLKGILFLRTGNSCRSQMAEGFAKKMLPKNMEIFSAGLEPKSVHSMAVKVMQEISVDISHLESKNISEISLDKINIVITLCGDAAENCPVFPGKVERIHWEIEDPAKAQESEEEIAKVFRKVRDKIKFHIENEKWVDSLED